VGCSVKFNRLFLLGILLPALSLCSCYHEFGKGGGTGGTGGGVSGNTIVYITVTSSPSQTFSFPALFWPIGTIQFINNSGTSVGVGSPLPIANFTRLQTDSVFLGHAVIPAGSYTNVKVELNGPFPSFFYNNSNATLLGCATATVCLIPATVSGFGALSATVPFTFTGQSGGSMGVDINLDFSKAVTSTGGMTFDFTQTGAIVGTVLPRTGQSAGLDSLENFTGAVTTKTGTTVTVQPLKSIANAGTFTMAATVEFDDPFSVCSGTAGFSCLAVNQNVSVDGVLNSDGTLTAYEVEFLDPATPITQELEGVIVSPLTNGQFKMALTNQFGTVGFNVGSLVTVSLSGAETYVVDPKNLGISTTPLGFQSQTDLVLGQTVLLQGGTINDANTSLSDPTRVMLRYSSISGTVTTGPSGNLFTLGSVDPFFNSLVANSVQVETFQGITTFDNITGISGLTAGTKASVRALYLNPNSGATPPVLASQVRTH
jgi:hypothetical protein